MRLIMMMLVVVLLPCAVASGAEVTASTYTERGPYMADADIGTQLSVLAASGERNQLTLTADAAAFTLVDTGAPLTAGAGCTAESASQVRCRRATVSQYRRDDITLTLGDEDDDVTIAVPWTAVSLGAGDDRLAFVKDAGTASGDAGDDVLVGSAGPDVLFGGTGSDELHAGAGDDGLEGGPDDDADVLDGGPGSDEVTPSPTRRPVSADLTAGLIGPDRVIDVESVLGGLDDDILLGSAGPDQLTGSGSVHGDRLEGRGGDDILFEEESPYVHSRHDVLLGGAGDDELWAPSRATVDGGAGDDLIGSSSEIGPVDHLRLRCGPGRDVVYDIAMVVPRDCEAAGFGALGRFDRPRRSGHTLRIEVRRSGPACTMRLRAVADGRPLSRWRSRPFRPGATTVRTLRLLRVPAPTTRIDLQIRPVHCADGRYAEGGGARARSGTLRFAR